MTRFIKTITVIVALWCLTYDKSDAQNIGIYTGNKDFNINAVTFDMIPCASPRNYSVREIMDTSNLSILYEYSYNTDIENPKKAYDLQLLQIGNKVNRFYSRNGEFRDSVNHDNLLIFLKTGEEQGFNIDFKKNGRPIYSDIFTYKDENKRLISERFQDVDYRYTENIDNIEWELLPQTDTISGYRCHKATCTFRGRNWHVWYTLDIPYGYGPWKLSGLPGLILKAKEQDGLFCWEAIGIERPVNQWIYVHSEKKEPFKGFDRHKVKNSSRKNNAKLLKISWMYPMYISNNIGSKLYVNDKEVDLKSLPSNRKYYPQLELE